MEPSMLLIVCLLLTCVSGAFGQSETVTNITLGASKYFYGKQITLSFVVNPVYSSSSVQLELVKGNKETACPLLRYPFRVDTTAGTNNTKKFDVPTCTAEGTDYKIRIVADGSASNYDSDTFEIAASNENCVAGSFSDTGTEPGCVLCNIGTYQPSGGASSCLSCDEGVTTSFRGATEKSSCSETVIPPTQGFIKFDKMYFYHSNAGGVNLIESDHKTQDECAALCKQDPGCKAFDAGGVTGTMNGGGPPLTPLDGIYEVFQAGDCFLSYDRIDTIKDGDVGIVNQLELFVKLEAQLVKDIFFRKTPNCYISESNDGGAYRDEHSPEACAQLCLDDMSCVSFDAGIVAADPSGQSRWQPAIDDCFLSYKATGDVDAEDFICDSNGVLEKGDPGLDYYERIVPKYLDISKKFDSLSSWDGAFENVRPKNDGWNAFDYQETGFFNFTFGDAANRCWCNGKIVNGSGNSCEQWGGVGGQDAWCYVNSNCPFAQNAGDGDFFVSPCFDRVRAPVKCPNVFSYQAEVLDIFPFLVSRDDFADKVKDALTTTLNRPLVARVEAKSDEFGAAAGDGITTATVNMLNAPGDKQFDIAFPEGQAKTLTLAGLGDVTVTARAAKRCAAGHASQSGFLPGCQICPPDTFANRPQTSCLPCPLGTVSDAGSSTTGDKACRPTINTVATRLGAFRKGYEWVGVYKTPLGSNGGGRNGIGAMTLKVLSAEDKGGGTVAVDTAISVFHGEDCPPNSGCRNPGITEYFMAGSVTSGTDLLISWQNRWHGITDRNTNLFSPGDISAKVAVKDRNTMLTGQMYNLDYDEGDLVLYERCHAADESGTFKPGNRFVGTAACYRRGTDMQGQTSGNDPCETSREGNLPEKDVRPMFLDVTGYSADTGLIYADITIEHEEGTSQYEVSGTFDNASGAIAFNAGAGAWNTGHPSDIPARQISGRLSDDGEIFIAQYNPNPNCKCNGTKLNNQGASCKVWSLLQGELEPWCFVSESCPDRRPVTNMPRSYIAGCNINPTDFSSTENKYQTCDDVTLYRICSLGAPNCPSGWVSDTVQDRCLRTSTTFPSEDEGGGAGVADRNFTAAQAFCKKQNSTLMSIHSSQENDFVHHLVKDETNVWIGLNRTAGADAWVDLTPYTFSPLDSTTDSGCGKYVTSSRQWEIEDCSKEKAFVCKRIPLGHAADDCACTGVADVDGLGGRCNFWDGYDRAAWCYVSDSCVQGVKYGGSLLRKAPCYDGPAQTTTPPPTPYRSTIAPLSCTDGTFQMHDKCVACTTATDCETNAYLVGECKGYTDATCQVCPPHFWRRSNTECVPCDVRCGTCNGTGFGDCLSCATAGPNYLEMLTPSTKMGACVGDCHVEGDFYKDNATKSCKQCTAHGAAPDYIPCSEFTDTKCNGITSCLAGTEKNAAGCCIACELGVTFNGNDGGRCLNVQPCGRGLEEHAPATLTHDTACRPCEIGKYSNDSNSCVDFTRCGAGTEEDPSIVMNEYTDRQCVDCRPGYFSVGDGDCVAHIKVCIAGEQQRTPPSSSSDRVCESCVAGDTFSVSGAGCANVTECDSDQLQLVAPSKSSDRVCVLYSTQSPTTAPSITPSAAPTLLPSTFSPTQTPTSSPSSFSPTQTPTSSPSTHTPTQAPTLVPSGIPTTSPTSSVPTYIPTSAPTIHPCVSGTHGCDLGTTYCVEAGVDFVCECRAGLTRVSAKECALTSEPTSAPTTPTPTMFPSTTLPSAAPTVSPTRSLTSPPTNMPSSSPTRAPTRLPTVTPTQLPTTASPTSMPTQSPSVSPSQSPTPTPTHLPTVTPSQLPTTASPTTAPTHTPTPSPTSSPTISVPTSAPTRLPTFHPCDGGNDCSSGTYCAKTLWNSTNPEFVAGGYTETKDFTCVCNGGKWGGRLTRVDRTTCVQTEQPTTSPTTSAPTTTPTVSPTSAMPTISPSLSPTLSNPTLVPSTSPTTSAPSHSPTSSPTSRPTMTPTFAPSSTSPSGTPTTSPSYTPSTSPTVSPSSRPSSSPTQLPSRSPTLAPTSLPSQSPSPFSTFASPTTAPSLTPTHSPSHAPTVTPTTFPTFSSPSLTPTYSPTLTPTSFPTLLTSSPTLSPTTFASITNSSVFSNNNSATVTISVIFIVVFVVLLICCCCVGFLGFFCWRKKKKEKHATNMQYSNPLYDNGANFGLPTTEHGPKFATMGQLGASSYMDGEVVSSYLDVHPRDEDDEDKDEETTSDGYLDITPNPDIDVRDVNSSPQYTDVTATSDNEPLYAHLFQQTPQVPVYDDVKTEGQIYLDVSPPHAENDTEM